MIFASMEKVFIIAVLAPGWEPVPAMVIKAVKAQEQKSRKKVAVSDFRPFIYFFDHIVDFLCSLYCVRSYMP